MSREEFLDQFSSPVLVLQPFARLDESTARIETVVGAGSGAGQTMTVAMLCKRPGANAFAQMITIGRAGNNDLCIPAEGISKFHCYIMFARKEASLTDAGSTNGTRVRNELLAARARTKLESGDSIQLGSIEANYYDPQAFYEFLLAGLADTNRWKPKDLDLDQGS